MMRYFTPEQLLNYVIEDEKLGKRSHIWPGDTLLFHSKKGLGSKIIQLGTDSDFNHVATYIGKGLLVEADATHGIVIKHLNWYIKHKNDIDLIVVKRPKYISPMENNIKYKRKDGEHTVKHALHYIGTKYDKLALIGFAFKFLGISLFKNIFNIKGRFFCSEFWTIHNRDAGIHVVENISDASLVSPADINNDYNMVEVKL